MDRPRAGERDLTQTRFSRESGKMFLQEIFDRRHGLGEDSEFAQAPLKEDASLVQRLRHGDDEAFEEMVRNYGGRLLATARRYLRSEDDARDTLQDAFFCAFK